MSSKKPKKQQQQSKKNKSKQQKGLQLWARIAIVVLVIAALFFISYAHLQNFPREKMGMVLGIWGISMMLAPAIGPTSGRIPGRLPVLASYIFYQRTGRHRKPLYGSSPVKRDSLN